MRPLSLKQLNLNIAEDEETHNAILDVRHSKFLTLKSQTMTSADTKQVQVLKLILSISVIQTQTASQGACEERFTVRIRLMKAPLR